MLCCWCIFCIHIVMHIVLHGFKFVICICVSLVFCWISFFMVRFHAQFCAHYFMCFLMPMCCWLLSYHMFIHFILLVRCYHACYMPLDLCVYVFFCSMRICWNLFVVLYVLLRNGRKHVFIASTATPGNLQTSPLARRLGFSDYVCDCSKRCDCLWLVWLGTSFGP